MVLLTVGTKGLHLFLKLCNRFHGTVIVRVGFTLWKLCF
jgi:hypothetical protein